MGIYYIFLGKQTKSILSGILRTSTLDKITKLLNAMSLRNRNVPLRWLKVAILKYPIPGADSAESAIFRGIGHF